MNADFRFSWKRGGLLLALLALAGCVSMPSGPSQMSLSGTGKSFDQFRSDDTECRQYATAQIGGNTPEQAATDTGVKSAAVGTAVGAAAGALIGGTSRGAGVGAGVGLLGGALAGSSTGYQSGHSLQQRYDSAYFQCMYAKGHKVPVTGRYTSSHERESRDRPAYYSPPPPPPPASPSR